MFLGVDPGINTWSLGKDLDLCLGLGIDVITTIGLDPQDLGLGTLGHLGQSQGLDVLGPDNTDIGLGLVLDTRVLKIMLFLL